ncbi:peptidase m20 [Lucifera butyrica]|uniref:Peptidase m20 n=1 Tax=Lucifera butyrica TaxID=1351585 RepID=A0A498R5F3_9FIRM|nr:M20/M25/M40 family metallo-hydrolase [Lucifera butyrica]VBB05423.1 peptidase m20 [Lucifera butyrica]
MSTLKELVAGQFADYLKDLETITNIDSGTGDAEGSAKIADFLKQRLEEAGGKVEFRNNTRGTHVISRFKGTGTRRILMIAHTDTVFPKGEVQKRPFHFDEQTMKAYGPGVGDDKATVVQTLYIMKALQKLQYDKYGEIMLYYNAEEETGSKTSSDIIIELAKQADLVIIMDTARPNWGIVTRRKGSAKYEVKVEGIAGHAGNVPYRTASATMELGNQITQLFSLASTLPRDPLSLTPDRLQEQGIMDYGQFIPENTINVGMIGTTNQKINVIPDNAFAKFEVRSYKMSELERLDREIKALAEKSLVPGTKVKISGKISMGPMEKTPQVQQLVNTYKEVVQREYYAQVVEWVAGGITDGNLAARYAPTIDALGVENGKEHTPDEYADLKTVGPRTVALVAFIQQISEQQTNH